jgi:hypothetical protein
MEELCSSTTSTRRYKLEDFILHNQLIVFVIYKEVRIHTPIRGHVRGAFSHVFLALALDEVEWFITTESDIQEARSM